MHKIIIRQLKKYLNITDVNKISEKFKELIIAVSQTYDDFDRDIRLIDRSMEISSRELKEKNSELIKEAEVSKLKKVEVEKLNNLMIGRELKMVELKKENKELKTKLNNQS